MHYKFTKMEGLGNDFIVFDAVTHALELDSDLIRRLADRHYGVGCDQVLIAEPSADPALDFRYRIFNADGSEVEQCGNGARCFARFVRDQGLTDKTEIAVETNTGIVYPKPVEAAGVTITAFRGKLHLSSLVVGSLIVLLITMLAAIPPAIRAMRIHVLRAIYHA